MAKKMRKQIAMAHKKQGIREIKAQAKKHKQYAKKKK